MSLFLSVIRLMFKSLVRKKAVIHGRDNPSKQAQRKKKNMQSQSDERTFGNEQRVITYLEKRQKIKLHRVSGWTIFGFQCTGRSLS
jgi:uncharacterized protein YjhX (UPF0386 family)